MRGVKFRNNSFLTKDSHSPHKGTDFKEL